MHRTAATINAGYANETAHLFKPVNLDAAPVNTPLSPRQSQQIELHNCEVAKQIHKTPPPDCTKLR